MCTEFGAVMCELGASAWGASGIVDGHFPYWVLGKFPVICKQMLSGLVVVGWWFVRDVGFL